MKVLIAIIVLLSIFMLYQSYFYVNPDFTILQATLPQLTPTILKERLPIVVYDIIKQASDLLKSPALSWRYLINVSRKSDSLLHKTMGKYTVLINESTEKPAYMYLAHPNDLKAQDDPAFQNWIRDGIVKTIAPPDEKSIESFSETLDNFAMKMKIKPQGAVILPTHWAYMVIAEQESMTEHVLFGI